MSETTKFLARAELIRMLVEDELSVSLVAVCTLIHEEEINVSDEIKELSTFNERSE